MDRRDFCRSLLAAGAGATGAALAPAARAAADTRWTLGYEGLLADAAPMPLDVRGRLPRGFEGVFYRNGPARHALGGVRYQHPFDGDGMLQRYAVQGGAIVHDGRFVRTGKWLADSAAGHPVRAAFGTNPPGMEPISAPDAMNVANTSVVHHGGELLALWEGGSAIRIDERTLESSGTKVWSPDYAGMPFSAHPKVEPADGTLWNFGVSSFRGLLSVYRIDAGGRLLAATTLPVPQMAMVHDFAVTERHLVFLLPPLVFDTDRARSGATFLDSHVWRPELGLRVLVLPKDRLDQPQWFELPAGFVFHVGNAWEDGAATIRLDCMRAPSAWGATTRLKALMRGDFIDGEFAAVTLVALDLQRRQATQTVLPQLAEFPRVDPRVVGRRHRGLYAALRLAPGDRPGYDAVMRLDTDKGRVDHWRYGADVMAEEHIFVPRPGSVREGDGWLVGTALDIAQRRMLFSVFDAMHVADGPLAQATLARPMPLGLHGIFVAA